jgi:hypothetical protein
MDSHAAARFFAQMRVVVESNARRDRLGERTPARYYAWIVPNLSLKARKPTKMDTPLELARKQIAFARSYTLSLLEDVDDDQWFTVPGGAETHVAWQVAHLAMAQYGLCLFRQRGRAGVDRELLPRGFVQKYGKGSTPDVSPENNLTPAEIREVLQRVNAQACEEMENFTDEQLKETIDMPYAVYPTKLGALVFCADHEMLHAGQIGLLRRLLGKAPIR